MAQATHDHEWGGRRCRRAECPSGRTRAAAHAFAPRHKCGPNLREAASRGALDDKPCGTNEEDAAAALRELRYLRERRHRAQCISGGMDKMGLFESAGLFSSTGGTLMMVVCAKPTLEMIMVMWKLLN